MSAKAEGSPVASFSTIAPAAPHRAASATKSWPSKFSPRMAMKRSPRLSARESEQTVVIDDEIYDLALRKFAELGAHICNEEETKVLERTVMDLSLIHI